MQGAYFICLRIGNVFECILELEAQMYICELTCTLHVS